MTKMGFPNGHVAGGPWPTKDEKILKLSAEISNLKLEIERLKADNNTILTHRPTPGADNDHEPHWFREAQRLEAENSSLKESLERLRCQSIDILAESRRDLEYYTNENERLSKDWSSLVDASAKYSSENSTLRARIAKLEAVREAAEQYNDGHKRGMDNVKHVQLLCALDVALRAAGEEV